MLRAMITRVKSGSYSCVESAMPIYEFYCGSCHTIFNFLSRRIDTETLPKCPKCKKQLQRQVSMFAAIGKAKGGDEMDDLPIDESKMESAMEALAGEAEGINEDDPRQAAQLMRKFSRMTGMEFGAGMETALNRLESGEDPEQIEAEMGDIIENEEPFIMPGKKGRTSSWRRQAPSRDSTLYEM
jgi:putative FmdB family regulatory protein